MTLDTNQSVEIIQEVDEDDIGGLPNLKTCDTVSPLEHASPKKSPAQNPPPDNSPVTLASTAANTITWQGASMFSALGKAQAGSRGSLDGLAFNEENNAKGTGRR